MESRKKFEVGGNVTYDKSKLAMKFRSSKIIAQDSRSCGRTSWLHVHTEDSNIRTVSTKNLELKCNRLFQRYFDISSSNSNPNSYPRRCGRVVRFWRHFLNE